MRNNHLILAKEWIIKGQNDLRAAEILYKEKGPPDTLCFHCHQAVEKYLKGFLVFNNIHFEKIHSLWRLGSLCVQIDKELLEFEKSFKTLDAYYIESRYPPETRVYSFKEGKEVLEMAQEITQFVVGKITKLQ